MITVLIGLLIESDVIRYHSYRILLMSYKVVAHERLLLMKELEKVFETLKLGNIILA